MMTCGLMLKCFYIWFLLVQEDSYIYGRAWVVLGTTVAQWLRCCATNRKVAGPIPTGVSGFFIDIKSFRSHYGPRVDSASNINEYQVYFLGGKSGRCVRLTTYHHPVPLSRNLGTLTSWNPLGLSWPVMGLLYLSCIVVDFINYTTVCSISRALAGVSCFFYALTIWTVEWFLFLCTDYGRFVLLWESWVNCWVVQHHKIWVFPLF